MQTKSTTRLSPVQIDELRTFDSPTIANAIEAFNVRDRTEGFASLELCCIYPAYKPVIGYAVTCTEDTASPGRKGSEEDFLNYEKLYRAIEAAPKPVILVTKNIGSDRLRSCHLGDIMALIFHRLGTTAFVTDGGIRDTDGIRKKAPGFQVFAAGMAVSHGIPRLVEVGITVSIFGLTIKPGELLHGDVSGLVSIPIGIAEKLADQARRVLDAEQIKTEFIKSPDFSLDAWGKRFGF